MLNMIVQLNNAFVRLCNRKQPSSRVLVLLPHCIQASDCDCTVTDDMYACKRCGRCALAEITAECESYGVPGFVVSGGQRAVQKVREYKPKLIIAVACSKELLMGLASVFPTPVYAVTNQTPNGPCKDTTVEKGVVTAALARFVQKKEG